MQYRHSMKTGLFFETPGQAESVLRAVKADFQHSFKRSKSKVSIEGNSLKIEIMASDLTALRASFNSIMKSIVVSGNILKAFE